MSLWKAGNAEFHPSLERNESRLKFKPTVVEAVPFCPDSPGHNKGLLPPSAGSAHRRQPSAVSPFWALPLLMKTASPKVTPLCVAAHIQFDD